MHKRKEPGSATYNGDRKGDDGKGIAEDITELEVPHDSRESRSRGEDGGRRMGNTRTAAAGSRGFISIDEKKK